MLAQVGPELREGDVVYVYFSAMEAFRYYQKRYGFEGFRVVRGVKSRTNWKRYREDLSQLAGNKRVWIIFSRTSANGTAWTRSCCTCTIWTILASRSPA